jgi:hypothetical protein
VFTQINRRGGEMTNTRPLKIVGGVFYVLEASLGKLGFLEFIRDHFFSDNGDPGTTNPIKWDYLTIIYRPVDEPSCFHVIVGVNYKWVRIIIREKASEWWKLDEIKKSEFIFWVGKRSVFVDALKNETKNAWTWYDSIREFLSRPRYKTTRCANLESALRLLKSPRWVFALVLETEKNFWVYKQRQRSGKNGMMGKYTRKLGSLYIDPEQPKLPFKDFEC